MDSQTSKKNRISGLLVASVVAWATKVSKAHKTRVLTYVQSRVQQAGDALLNYFCKAILIFNKVIE